MAYEKFKKYRVTLNIGSRIEPDYINVFIPGRTKNEVKQYCAGNGEIIKMEDVSDALPISESHVFNALKLGGFGDAETQIILRALSMSGITQQ